MFRTVAKWFRIQFPAMTVRVRSTSIRSADLVSWSWIEDLGVHLNDRKYFGRKPFLKLYTNFKQFKSKRLFKFNNSKDLNKGSVCALYLLSEIILMKRFWIFQGVDNWNPMLKYNMLHVTGPYCSIKCVVCNYANIFSACSVLLKISLTYWLRYRYESSKISSRSNIIQGN